jgi:hypothetical protein
MRSTRWYLASVVSGLILTAIMLTSGLIGGSRSAIVVEWGLCEELLEGCEVEIDGDVVGRLQHFGKATRTGFEVKEGSHTLAIVHPEMDCELKEITTGGSHRSVTLIADVNSWVRPDGSTESVIVFQ